MSTLLQRFMSKISPEPNSGCWLWSGAIADQRGYGVIWDNDRQGNRSAHRLSYEVHKGPVGDLAVCHHCDNPSCVNPDHLFLGTFKDNAHDKMRKGRHQDLRGENSGTVKITAEIVADIRKKRMGGSAYARLYGISPQNVCDIQKRRTWKHI